MKHTGDGYYITLYKLVQIFILHCFKYGVPKNASPHRNTSC